MSAAPPSVSRLNRKFDLADNLQRQAESRNVRHYHKTKAVHLPGGGSNGGYGDSGQSKSHESMKGESWRRPWRGLLCAKRLRGGFARVIAAPFQLISLN